MTLIETKQKVNSSNAESAVDAEEKRPSRFSPTFIRRNINGSRSYRPLGEKFSPHGRNCPQGNISLPFRNAAEKEASEGTVEVKARETSD